MVPTSYDVQADDDTYPSVESLLVRHGFLRQSPTTWQVLRHFDALEQAAFTRAMESDPLRHFHKSIAEFNFARRPKYPLGLTVIGECDCDLVPRIEVLHSAVSPGRFGNLPG
jgi:hypothetical protein